MLITTSSLLLQAQDKSEKESRLFFSTGFVVPQLYGGTELMNAANFRENGISYFENNAGERKAVGEYGSSTGYSFSMGYYLSLPKIKGLSIGLLMSNAQTGSSPSNDGYDEAYFFNFLNFGLGAQYYPLENSNLYLKGDIGLGSVFTKNRFINESGDQDFLHHFGIGLETGGAVGYTFTPFKDKAVGLYIEGQYQYYSTRVEVSEIGDDQWTFEAFRVSVGIEF